MIRSGCGWVGQLISGVCIHMGIYAEPQQNIAASAKNRDSVLAKSRCVSTRTNQKYYFVGAGGGQWTISRVHITKSKY